MWRVVPAGLLVLSMFVLIDWLIDGSIDRYMDGWMDRGMDGDG